MAADARRSESGTPLRVARGMVERPTSLASSIRDGRRAAPMAAVPATRMPHGRPDAARRPHRTTPHPRRSRRCRHRRRGRGDAARLNGTPRSTVARVVRRAVPFRPCPTACPRPVRPSWRACGRDERPPARAGMSRPTTTEDEWWLAILWSPTTAGSCHSWTSPAAGPRPEPPLALLGPSFAGALERDDPRGRRAARPFGSERWSPPTTRPVPGGVPAAVRAGFRWGRASRRDAS